MREVSRPGYENNPKAEAAARARGYIGPWPPLTCTSPENADDLIDIVGKIEKGEHRGTFAQALEKYTFSFFRNMNEEQFRRMARAVINVAIAEKNVATVRSRAARLLVNPMNKALKIMLKLEDAADSEGIQHLQKCFKAYVEELSLHKDEIKLAGELLFKMVESPDSSDTVRLVGVEAIMDLILGTLSTLATVQEHDSRDLRLRTPVDKTSPKVIAAYAEMDELEAKLQTKIHSEESSDRESA
jgi:hypothetical protein